MDKKSKKRVQVLREKIKKLRTLLVAAKEQNDDPQDVTDLEKEITTLEAEVKTLSAE